MRVIVWGLGYVGMVSAACLAQLGHEVVGVEPNLTKVQAVNAGRSAVNEPGLELLIHQMVEAGRLRATQDGRSLVPWADLSLICVGTPSAVDGSPTLDYVRNVAVDIAHGLRDALSYHVVVLRSTVFPGTARNILRTLLEAHSCRQVGRDFGLVTNPEFLRETSAIGDFHAPPYIVIGEFDTRSGDQVEALYRNMQAPLYRVMLEEAELLKLVNNAFHALKIGFANEISRLCDRLNIDSHVVMRLVCADTKLNISPAYLRPGFAFGGSCLPKDLRSLTFNARGSGVELPILEAVLPSNQLQIEAARLKVHELNARRVAVLGLSFKPGTDDLRESPVIDLIRYLWQDGVDVLVHDPDVRLDDMLGSNREYLERQLPQINQILCSRLEDALDTCDAVVVSQRRPEFATALQSLNGRTVVLDLVRLSEGLAYEVYQTTEESHGNATNRPLAHSNTVLPA
jgi:GDP-mannose 6-dehydrogenase